MDVIDDKNMPTREDRTESMRALALELQADPAALSAALFETLDRMALPWSVKEVATGRYLQVSAAMAEAFDRAAPDFPGLTDADLMDAAKATAIRSAEQAGLAHEVAGRADVRLDVPGGKRVFGVARTPVPRADGSAPRHLLSVWFETTAAQRREEQLQLALAQLERQQVAVEPLRPDPRDETLRDRETGLHRHPHFEDQLRREVDLSSREHREFALVVIAIDPPTDAVEALGSGASRLVLEALGQLLRSNTRAMDASCRLDEGRFAILLSGVGLATAHSRMEGLRRQCATQIIVQDSQDFGFTVSMGVASFPHTAHTEPSLLEAANKALAEAQRRGGNHVALASISFESLGG